MYKRTVGNCWTYISEVKRHSNERHPLFYLMSFISLYSPLTDSLLRLLLLMCSLT